MKDKAQVYRAGKIMLRAVRNFELSVRFLEPLAVAAYRFVGLTAEIDGLTHTLTLPNSPAFVSSVILSTLAIPNSGI